MYQSGPILRDPQGRLIIEAYRVVAIQAVHRIFGVPTGGSSHLREYDAHTHIGCAVAGLRAGRPEVSSTSKQAL